MFELMVTDEKTKEVKLIKKFLKWADIEYRIIVNECDVLFLNQGSETALFMEDHMIIAKGFFNIVECIKNRNYIGCG